MGKYFNLFLKALSLNGVGRALQTKKLRSRFVGTLQNHDRVVPIAYRFVVLVALSSIHNIFLVSQLQKCITDPSYLIEPRFL